MRTRAPLRALAAATDRLHAEEEHHRDAMRAASAAGASLRQIAAQAGLSHEQVRRIIREPRRVAPYLVTVERRGVSPLQAQLLVRADSRHEAGDLAACIAERRRGGIFEAIHIRRAAKAESAYPPLAYDDIEP